MSPAEVALAADLSRAASYRFLSRLFATPTDEVRDELAELAPEVVEGLREEAAEVSRASGKGLQGLYHRLLGPSGQVPDVECAYDDNTAGGRGPLIADVAGFYRAFAFVADAEETTPDHVTRELDFLGWLALKSAYARHEGDEEHLGITERAREAFLRDHAGRWLVPFLERLARAGEGTHYEAVAVLASRTLRELEGDVFDRPPARMRLPVIDDEDEVATCG